MKHLQVAIIDQKSADAFLSRHHYLGDSPAGSAWRFGLYEKVSGGERLCGAAVLSTASRPGIPLSVLPAGGLVLELRRFATDTTEPNAGSWFMSAFLKLLPPDVRGVISYADPSRGHHGGLYQACGAIFLGSSSAKSGEAPKHRYLFQLGRGDVEIVSPASHRPYPKPDKLPEIPQRSEQDLRALALALDLEGCIAVYAGPYVGIGQHGWRRFLLDKVRSWAGVSGRINQRHDKNHFDWIATGPEAIALCQQIEPYLICKAPQARAVLKFPLGRQGVRLPPEALEARRKLADLTSKLNESGPKDKPPEGAQERASAWIERIKTLDGSKKDELLALSIDFEGAITIRRGKNPAMRRGYYFEPVISLSQVQHRECLLEVIQALAGVGTICRTGRSEESLPEGWSPMKAWRASGEEAIELARRLAPALSAKREHANVLINYQSGGTITDAVFDARNEAYLKCRALNEKDVT